MIILLIALYGLVILALWLGLKAFQYMSIINTIKNPYELINVLKVRLALDTVGIILLLLFWILLIAMCILVVYDFICK